MAKLRYTERMNDQPPSSPAKSFVVFVIGLLSALYLINPGAGFVELIPDNLPLIGNLDEATAAALLLACLRYFGFDPLTFFTRERKSVDEPIDVEGKKMP